MPNERKRTEAAPKRGKEEWGFMNAQINDIVGHGRGRGYICTWLPKSGTRHGETLGGQMMSTKDKSTYKVKLSLLFSSPPLHIVAMCTHERSLEVVEADPEELLGPPAAHRGLLHHDAREGGPLTGDLTSSSS